ncbi:PTS transporter subunit IIC [Klebsiella michiganensis]|uniref:PTS transporter subunit IIC n=1 Tax=Klebsiella michiganensis TaxID=1134687 RepID=UPI002B1CB11E|nr:PTS transporter subunit IIC [Klebsiella michiganensis]
MGQARFSERYGSSVTIAIAGGFAINLLLARLTRFKYIYLTEKCELNSYLNRQH